MGFEVVGGGQILAWGGEVKDCCFALGRGGEMPRPGPRPYECVRRAWHSERHHAMRGTLIQEMFRLVAARLLLLLLLLPTSLASLLLLVVIVPCLCLFRVVNDLHGSATKKNKEWQEKLPIVVLKAEEIMYSKANSEVDLTLFFSCFFC